MQLPIYQVDAFSEQPFSGNPAAIVLCDDLLPETTMQHIAAENNLAETAFVFRNSDPISIRWFTPTIEVDLCGHATLAAAHVLFEQQDNQESLVFDSRSGPLRVRQSKGRIWLDFPTDQFSAVDNCPSDLCEGLGREPLELYRGGADFLAILDSEREVSNLSPDFARIKQVQSRGIIVSAPGNEVDFVSRFFAPQSGIPEDPVTGSAHTTLIPYWSTRLNKHRMTAKQVSERGGVLHCEDRGDRVEIGGQAVTYLRGEILF